MERSLPDLPNRVFVYGSLKSGQPNHDYLLEGEKGVARCLGPARTREAYPLVVSTQWNVPFLLDVRGTGKLIYGEVYEVDDRCLEWLDKLEHYPELYLREYITIELLTNDDVTEGGVSSGAVPNTVSDDAVTDGDVNGSAKPRLVTCWVYFLKDYPPAMLNLKMYSTYQSDDAHQQIKGFIKTDGRKILEELRESFKSQEESQV